MINENNFIYETFLYGEFPFNMTFRVTDSITNLHEDCNQYNNYKSNFTTARNRLIRKLETLNKGSMN